MESSTRAWTWLRRGATGLHLSYGETYTNNLFGHNVRVCLQPSLQVVLDLNPNLHKRNKATNSYIDARELADGAIKRIRLVQITDEYILKGLGRVLRQSRGASREWILIIELEGDHAFRVRPERDATGSSLFLRVVSETTGAV